jgi:hypothetical protein
VAGKQLILLEKMIYPQITQISEITNQHISEWNWRSDGAAEVINGEVITAPNRISFVSA